MLLLITIATALVWLSSPQASIDVVIDYDWYCSGVIISSSGEYWCCYWLRLILLWCDYLVLRQYWCCYWLRLILLWCDYLVLRRVLMLLLITIATALLWLSRPRASIDVVIDYDCYCSGVIISSSGEYWCCYWLRLLLLWCDYLVLRRVLMLLLITIGTALVWLSSPQASIDVVIDYDCYCSGVII